MWQHWSQFSQFTKHINKIFRINMKKNILLTVQMANFNNLHFLFLFRLPLFTGRFKWISIYTEKIDKWEKSALNPNYRVHCTVSLLWFGDYRYIFFNFFFIILKDNDFHLETTNGGNIIELIDMCIDLRLSFSESNIIMFLRFYNH